MAVLGGLTLKGFSGCIGVPNAGDEEGIADDGGTWARLRKMGAGVLSMLGKKASLTVRHDLELLQ